MNCLNKAASNGALGTGNLNYPPALSAQYMIEAVMEYSQENPKSSITQVKVIVFHLDIKTKKVWFLSFCLSVWREYINWL